MKRIYNIQKIANADYSTFFSVLLELDSDFLDDVEKVVKRCKTIFNDDDLLAEHSLVAKDSFGKYYIINSNGTILYLIELSEYEMKNETLVAQWENNAEDFEIKEESDEQYFVNKGWDVLDLDDPIETLNNFARILYKKTGKISQIQKIHEGVFAIKQK